MDVIEEMAKRGGAAGVARQKLCDELVKARNDPNHFLRRTVEAFQRGANTKAAKLLFQALLDARQDKQSPLYEAALFLVIVPALSMKLEAARQFIETFSSSDDFGHRICVEDAVKMHDLAIDAARARASDAGASEGGKKGAATRGEKNTFRDQQIRASDQPAHELAERHGITERRVRQIKKEG